MTYVTAIVLAAGRGLRFRSKISKPLIKINSKPIIIYCLNILSKHPYIRDIIVVVNSKNVRSIISKIGQYRIGKIRDVVLGGRRRQDSVVKALRAMDARTDLVLIHDAVRPFIDKETISLVIKEAKKSGAAIVGVPVKATIKKVKSQKSKVKNRTSLMIEKTLDRDSLWEIQTPQVFKRELILKAYEKFGNRDVTDDSTLVEKLGVKARVILGPYSNIKITTPEDLSLAEAILRTKSVKRKA
jgi:2-C-methyl-D-erythritol 4-phosphate cytidylyltransferase